MDIIAQRREEAIQYQNADVYLEEAITHLAGGSKTIFIGKKNSSSVLDNNSQVFGIFGVLDFIKLMHGEKKHTIYNIEIEDGQKITDMLNIPRSVKTLKAPGQLLIDFNSSGLDDLEQLYLQNNYIEKIDLAHCNKLKILNLSGNHLRTIKLPDSLEELYLSGNSELLTLDVSDLKKLKVLDCKCSNLEKIMGVSKSVQDVRFISGTTKVLYGNVPEKEIKKERVNVEYNEALYRYFELKQKYDLGIERRRKIISSKKDLAKKEKVKEMQKFRPPCVVCKRSVGSIFKHVDGHYIALCGDADKPCKLKIKLFNGSFMSLEKRLEMMKQQVNELRERIMRYDLDRILNYSGEGGKKVTDDVVYSVMTEYNTFNTYYNELEELFKNTFHSSHKKELVASKLNDVHELLKLIRSELMNYSETDDTVILQGIVNIYKNELVPEIINLRNLKHPYMTVGVVNPFNDIASNEVRETILEQRPAVLIDTEVSIHEDMPEVIAFQI